jgi:hypothetical protein
LSILVQLSVQLIEEFGGLHIAKGKGKADKASSSKTTAASKP